MYWYQIQLSYASLNYINYIRKLTETIIHKTDQNNNMLINNTIHTYIHYFFQIEWYSGGL